MRRAYDVAIVGGGPAGCAAAITLARKGTRVAMVDASRPSTSFVETLPPGARPLLSSLGLWPSGTSDAHVPAYANESVWGSGMVARTDFTCDPHGCGWHVERAVFDQSLREVAQRAGVAIIAGANAAADRDRGGWRITLSNRPTLRLTADRLVDAAGRGGLLSRRLGVPSRRVDALVAVVAALLPRDVRTFDPDRTTFVEAGLDGWWFTAVTPAGRRVLAYFTDAAQPSARLAATSTGFRDLWRATTELKQRVCPEAWQLESSPRIRPAASSRLTEVGGEGWLAIGDAVMSFDPISSQGIVTAVYTGLRAGEALLTQPHWRDVLEVYGRQCNRVYTAYLEARRQCYANERRWSDRPFWRARQRVESGAALSVRAGTQEPHLTPLVQ
jgi:flavin-dependent dehydrogenase